MRWSPLGYPGDLRPSGVRWWCHAPQAGIGGETVPPTANSGRPTEGFKTAWQDALLSWEKMADPKVRDRFRADAREVRRDPYGTMSLPAHD
jgi:hypothetical protein